MNKRANQIIDCAIRMIREGGYHAFSFRQIATELGITSASIHYHFPSKEDLGLAVTRQYTEVFLESLGQQSDYERPVDYYIDAFQAALAKYESGCVCGILAAEAGRLPQSLIDGLGEFTQKNIEWLDSALRLQCGDWSDEKVTESALSMFSTLEGAIIFASLLGQPEHLEQTSNWLKKLCV